MALRTFNSFRTLQTLDPKLGLPRNERTMDKVQKQILRIQIAINLPQEGIR